MTKCLDVGCRNNKMRGAIGLDIERFDNDVVGDAHALPFQDRSFTLIRVYETFEHLHDPLSALKECHRVLKDQGKILVTIPNVHTYRRILRYFKNEEVHQDQDHIFTWTISEFRNFLRHGGFILTSWRFMDHPHWHKPFRSSFLMKHLTNQHTLIEGIKA